MNLDFSVIYTGKLREFEDHEIPDPFPFDAGQISQARLVEKLTTIDEREFYLVLEWQPMVPTGFFDSDMSMNKMEYASYGTVALCMLPQTSSLSVVHQQMSYAQALKSYLHVIRHWCRTGLDLIEELNQSVQSRNGFTVVKPP